MIKPTIGRQVWYWPSAADKSCMKHFIQPASDTLPQPFAATVCYVHHDRLVNLEVKDHWGNSHLIQAVPLVQPEDAKPELFSVQFCQWMPFQVGQAAGADTKAVRPAGEDRREPDKAGDRKEGPRAD